MWIPPNSLNGRVVFWGSKSFIAAVGDTLDIGQRSIWVSRFCDPVIKHKQIATRFILPNTFCWFWRKRRKTRTIQRYETQLIIRLFRRPKTGSRTKTSHLV